MQFIISSEKLREIFPAFIIVDRSGRILDFGPAIARHAPSVSAGDLLKNHFSGISGVDPRNLSELARETGRSFELHAFENGLVLTGAVIADSGRFLLALNPATASLNLHVANRSISPESMLHIADFTPGDPAVDIMLLVKMQQAMLEDAESLATSLTKERQRNEGLVERVSRLAGFLAHDFNNILSIIQLNAERLAALSSISLLGKRLASLIGETAERGSGITRSLMTISHENTERPSPQSVDALISQHLNYFSAIAGIDVIVNADLNAPSSYINVSAADFVNCLTNLLINSRDAISPPGTIGIYTRLTISPNSDDIEHLEVQVVDTGAGMDEQILRQVFEPFFSTKKQGNGIGLPAVADFVKECGGSVDLQSSPGRGTKVSLLFPLSMAEGSHPAPEVTGPLKPAAIDSPNNSDEPQTILLVEDEPYALEALVELLEAEGLEVWPARTAEEAVLRLEAEQSRFRFPNILLTDVVLPKKSGIELARATVASAPMVKVILMSGFVPTDLALESDWLFAPKPLNSARLMQLVKD